MTAIFISHRSTDAELAVAIKDWLAANGHKRFFLDVDPQQGIAAGAEWEQAIYDALRQCQAVLVVRTPDWDASRWCFAEFALARARGKPIFVVRARPCADGPLTPEAQEIDLTTDREGGLVKLARGLKEKGLDPRDPFDRDPDRPVYPGLNAFAEEDAAVFFGREEESWQGVEALEQLRRGGRGAPRLLLVTGASGCGKSSLVRAGIVPRLRRDPARWLRIRPFRPGADPFGGLARQLAASLADYGRHEAAEILARDLRADADGAVATGGRLVAMAQALKEAAGFREASVLLVIDQAEELLADAIGGRLLALIAAALADAGGELIGLATIRSDKIGAWQEHAAIRGAGGSPPVAARTFLLGPVPPDRVSEIVRGPARHLDLEVEDKLVDVIRADVEAPGALPLLAYVLQQLHARAGGAPRLTFASYQQLGGVAGAVARAADEAIRLGQLTPADLEALRAAIVPGLVRVTKDEFARLRAPRERIPPRAEPLIQGLIEARLLTTDTENGRETIEIAHDALLRSWPTLAGWLREDAAKLGLVESLRQAAAAWHAGGRRADFLVHRGRRLAAITTALQEPRFAEALGEDERRYLAACRGRQRRRLAGWAATTVAVLGLVVAAILAPRVLAQREAALIWAGLDLRAGESLRPDEIDTLWRLARAGDGVRREFVEQLVADPVLVRKLARNPLPVARAFGLAPEPPSLETAVAELLGALRPDSEPEQLQALAAILQKVPVTLTAEQAAAARDAFLGATRAGASLELLAILSGLQALALRLTPEQAAAALPPALRALDTADDRRRTLALGLALPTLAGRLAPDAVEAVRGPLLAAFRASAADPVRLQVLAPALRALPTAGVLASEQVDVPLAFMLQALRSDPDPPVIFRLARALEALAPSLDPAQARAAVPPLLDALAGSGSPSSFQAVAAALGALSPHLLPDDAARLFQRAFDAVVAGGIGDPFALAAWGEVLRASARRLNPAQATVLADPVLDAFQAHDRGLLRLQLLARALAELPVRLTDQQMTGLWADALTGLRGTADETSLIHLQDALAALARKLTPDSAAMAQEQALQAILEMRLGSGTDRLWVVAPAFAAFGAMLTPEQARPVAGLLVDGMLAGTDPLQLSTFASALEAIAANLAAEPASSPLMAMLGALEADPPPARVRALGRALEALTARRIIIGAERPPAHLAALESARRRLAGAGSPDEAAGWAAVAEALLRASGPEPSTYVAAVVEMLKCPTAAGDATTGLLDRLHERFPEAPGGAAGLQPNMAWIRQRFPAVDITARPVRPS